MSINLRKIQTGDLVGLIEKKAQSLVKTVSPEQARTLEAFPHAYTITIENEVKMCGGVIEYWSGRGEAWAVIDPFCKSGFANIRKEFVHVHRLVKEFLRDLPIRRIEAAVQTDFGPGHRWVKALGFKLDARNLEAFFPNGKDADLYSLVKCG